MAKQLTNKEIRTLVARLKHHSFRVHKHNEQYMVPIFIRRLVNPITREGVHGWALELPEKTEFGEVIEEFYPDPTPIDSKTSLSDAVQRLAQVLRESERIRNYILSRPEYLHEPEPVPDDELPPATTSPKKVRP